MHDSPQSAEARDNVGEFVKNIERQKTGEQTSHSSSRTPHYVPKKRKQ
jgi:hypothetical protein